MNQTILVVDDEDHIREMLQEYLGKHGFLIRAAENAAVARRLFADESIDLAVMDITMPGEDGLSLARHVKEHHRSVAIIMLTAADTVIDRVVGLEMGADDYLTKPFDPRELLARIKSVLRRMSLSEPKPVTEPARFRFGHCELDLDQRRLFTRDNAEVALTNGEFDLLKVFAEHANHVLTRDRILDLTQNREWDPYDRSVDIRITRLRRKIEPDPERPRYIKTVRGAGYRFVPDGE